MRDDSWYQTDNSAPDKPQPATREELVSALKEAELTMSHSRVFVTSRQRIKRPEGEDLYNETLGHIRDILSREENHGKH
jgi:hypothetical protein